MMNDNECWVLWLSFSVLGMRRMTSSYSSDNQDILKVKPENALCCVKICKLFIQPGMYSCIAGFLDAGEALEVS